MGNIKSKIRITPLNGLDIYCKDLKLENYTFNEINVYETKIKKELQIFDKKVSTEIEDYSKQVLLLKNLYTILDYKLNIKVKNDNELSKLRINEYIETILNNENINLEYIPDFAERKIYKNVFNLLINELHEILKTTSIQFLGHEILINMKPISDQK